jgi:hypothetical protein
MTTMIVSTLLKNPKKLNFLAYYPINYNHWHQIGFDIIHGYSLNEDQLFMVQEFEGRNYRFPREFTSAIRLSALYNMTPDISLSIEYDNISELFRSIFNSIVGLSSVFGLYKKPGMMEMNETFMIGFAELAPNRSHLLIDLYNTTLYELEQRKQMFFFDTIMPYNDIVKLKLCFFDQNLQVNIDVLSPEELIKRKISYWKSMISSKDYDSSKQKFIVFLDLDKTLYLSDSDCNKYQRHMFSNDFGISGTTVLTNERFHHSMMIRPGSHKFLLELSKIAIFCAITAGDIHYARAAVTCANLRKWTTIEEVGSKDLSSFPNVTIPLTHLFSVRNMPRTAQRKTFDRAIILPGDYIPVTMVDDDITSWDLSLRQYNISISPFQPYNNSPKCLEDTLDMIREKAKLFYTTDNMSIVIRNWIDSL